MTSATAPRTSPRDFPANPIDKPGYVLAFHDEFESDSLDGRRWIPEHLPQWSSRSRAAANHAFEDGHLVLKIDADQAPWCPEYDGEIRVSSLQTGVFSGPLGSPVGQHRFHPAGVVREAQANRILYAPQYGYFELRAKALITPGNHVALWMIGYEDEPQRSAEICICEVFGKHVRAQSSSVCFGVHPFNDPAITDDFRQAALPIDIADFHLYAAEWTPTHIDFFLDNRHMGTVRQSPSYPMQFMLGIYERPHELAPGAAGAQRGYPKKFVIDYFRAYQPVAGYDGFSQGEG